MNKVILNYILKNYLKNFLIVVGIFYCFGLILNLFEEVEFFKNLDNLKKIKDWEEAERRMEIIGQNGNDGSHYSELDLNQDGIIDEDEIKSAKLKIKSLYSQLDSGISSWRKNKIRLEIDKLQKQLPKDDDQTKTY